MAETVPARSRPGTRSLGPRKPTPAIRIKYGLPVIRCHVPRSRPAACTRTRISWSPGVRASDALVSQDINCAVAVLHDGLHLAGLRRPRLRCGARCASLRRCFMAGLVSVAVRPRRNSGLHPWRVVYAEAQSMDSPRCTRSPFGWRRASARHLRLRDLPSPHAKTVALLEGTAQTSEFLGWPATPITQPFRDNRCSTSVLTAQRFAGPVRNRRQDRDALRRHFKAASRLGGTTMFVSTLSNQAYLSPCRTCSGPGETVEIRRNF